MSGFLDNYGVVDAKREKIRKKIVLTVLGLLVHEAIDVGRGTKLSLEMRGRVWR